MKNIILSLLVCFTAVSTFADPYQLIKPFPMPASQKSAQPAADIWADYTITALVRKTAQDPWVVSFSGPFGVRSGYEVGLTLQDTDADLPQDPTCFSVVFFPLSENGTTLLNQEIQITEWHGTDIFCGQPTDPALTKSVGTIDQVVAQKQMTTLQLPFLAGKELKFELTQTWKPAP